MIRRASVLLIPTLAALAAAGTLAATGPEPAATVSARRVRADIEFLADDLLEGREAGTRGHEIAARYAASALEAAGWAPAADDGGWFQQVPLLESSSTGASLRLTRNGETSDIPLPGQAVVNATPWREHVEITAPVVFAGFGVTAPELGYDDYAGVDVRGKIVAVFSNAPSTFPSEPRAHYASADLKQRNAADRGAVALVTVLGPDDQKRYPWSKVTAYYGHPMMAWADANGKPGAVEQRLQASALLSPEATERLFAGAPLSLQAAIEGARKGRPGHGPLGATMTITSSSSHRLVTSPNVVARLKGSDAALGETSVVLTA